LGKKNTFEVCSRVEHHTSQIILTGGIIPENVFWGVAGTTTFFSTSHFEGILLALSTVWYQDYQGSGIAPLSGTGRMASLAFVEFANTTIISHPGVVAPQC